MFLARLVGAVGFGTVAIAFNVNVWVALALFAVAYGTGVWVGARIGEELENEE